jgi:hypothetical protein
MEKLEGGHRGERRLSRFRLVDGESPHRDGYDYQTQVNPAHR